VVLVSTVREHGESSCDAGIMGADDRRVKEQNGRG